MYLSLIMVLTLFGTRNFLKTLPLRRYYLERIPFFTFLTLSESRESCCETTSGRSLCVYKRGMSGVRSGGTGRASGGLNRAILGRKPIFTGGSRVKAWILNCSKRKLMLGEDIGLEDTVSLALCALVGRFSYRARSMMPLCDWVSENWYLLLGYIPEVVFLTKGWFDFHFKRAEDSALILEKLWSYGGGSLMLKRWHVSFDPA
jgi:hypothetical protein